MITYTKLWLTSSYVSYYDHLIECESLMPLSTRGVLHWAAPLLSIRHLSELGIVVPYCVCSSQHPITSITAKATQLLPPQPEYRPLVVVRIISTTYAMLDFNGDWKALRINR